MAMGFTLRERRRQAGSLRVVVRGDAKVPGEYGEESEAQDGPESPDSPDSVDGISSPGSPDSPDSPSPTASTFPPPPPPAQTSVASTSSIQSIVAPVNPLPPAATQSSVTTSLASLVATKPSAEPVATASPDATISEPSATTTFSTRVIPTLVQATASLTSTLALPQSSSATGGLGAEPTGSSQNGKSQAIQSSDGGGISQPSQIGLSTSGAAVILGIIFFIFWKFRRGRTQPSNSNSRVFSKLLPSRSEKEPQEDTQQLNVSNRPPDARTQSNIMDEVMAAAYAAEDGQNTFGNPQQYQQQQQFDLYAAEKQRPDSRSYPQDEMTAVPLPLNARMPPPRVPSIAAQTEMTSGTESTWRTWGVTQEKMPEENWVDKYVRNGGMK